MKKPLLVMLYASIFAIGCARVEVQAPKDPIKMDIAMRLDVYQHVAKDLDSIEEMVSGGTTPKKELSGFFISTAYANEDLGQEAQSAISRRRDRNPQISDLKGQGLIGENASGFLEAKSPNAPQDLIQAENGDRMLIYQAVAKKNGTSAESVGQVYGKKHQ